jgi:polynucleotide kinase-phosphatase
VNLEIPELSLVVLIGPSGCGKSTFAARHFRATEVLESDAFRAMVADDPADLEATPDAFEVLHRVAAKRLAAGRLTVVDATNVQPQARGPLVELARRHHCVPVAIVFDLPEGLCQQWNRQRERTVPRQAVHRHHEQLRRSLGRLQREGFRAVHVLRSPEAIDQAVVTRQRMWVDRGDLHGPFDIVGDVHGCLEELLALLAKLGWEVTTEPAGEGGAGPQARPVRHPEGRTAVFLGDLVDRGPDTPGVLRLVMDMVADGAALCLPGNHERKLLRALRGERVRVAHGLAESLRQLEGQPEDFVRRVTAFLDGLVSHFVLDRGRLVVAHAGLREELQGRASREVRDFALYGETTGETDEYGLPVRYDWARDYRGRAMVVYGHTPVLQPEWVNRTICVDTGCVFGGRLTALRYPERALVSVPASRVYYQPARPLGPPPTAPADRDGLLDLDDVLGKRIVATRLAGSVTVLEENAAAALEVMSRFAIDPRWLVYLPPTMAPCETSGRADLVEHPAEALDYFRRQGVERVVCERKHMGSRAVVVLCRDQDAARRRFGVGGGPAGACYTRTGRRMLGDPATEGALLERVRGAMEDAGLWRSLDSEWVVLDCELLPWSAKAGELLRQQYAAVGAAASASLDAAVPVLEAAAARTGQGAELAERLRRRSLAVAAYVDAYRRYCWPVAGLDDLRLAPFHLLASEGAVHAGREQAWHMETLAALARADAERHPVSLLVATPYQVAETAGPGAEASVTSWWEALTAEGGEGMVVKPWRLHSGGRRGLVQPAIKVRGREYLRIVYGPEYDLPEHLERLRRRSLGRKRSLALREFALGLEALERFVELEPLHRVHECVFGVLALESEPVDPRL